MKQRQSKRQPHTSWDPVANWYDGWMGKNGGQYHRHLAIPLLMRMVKPRPGETILDIGAGQGVLAPYAQEHGMIYTGVDAAPKLIRQARRHHPRATFCLGDARALPRVKELAAEMFDTAVFLLSIQDMDPLDKVLASAAWALRPFGRLVILMTHPCFRIPRQSGWGWDQGRKLRFRRIDGYLSRLQVPMKQYGRGQTTRSYHRPLQAYINGLSACGLMVDRIQEIPAGDAIKNELKNKADKKADFEIPLFLGIRALKILK